MNAFDRLRLKAGWIIGVIIPVLWGCAALLEKRPQVDTTAVKTLPALKAPDVRYRPALEEGKIYTVELRWKAENIRLFSHEAMQRLADSLGIARASLPHLTLWASDPVERPTQLFIDYLRIEPPNFYTNEERYHGNRIRHWVLSDRLLDGGKIEVVRRFRYRAYAIKYDLQPENVGPYQTDAFYRFYTREEPGLEQTEVLRDSARQITRNCGSALDRATALAEWLHQTAAYSDSLNKRGAATMLETIKDDEARYAMLYTALCRASGIPARLVSGFSIEENRRLRERVWNEFFLPNYGWIPADIAADMLQIGHLDHRRLIMCVGIDIPLVDLPRWALLKAEGIDNGNAFYMQLATTAAAGFTADMSSELLVVAEDDF
ncbi:transglutaminase domain-containing protein [candidate division KSB1 bacterium]|nr:transglutaminase domain-containing protein [candidate division KSB1 bacterium]